MSSDAFELSNQVAHLGRYRRNAAQALATLARINFSQRLWQRDATLWSADAAVAGKIANRLGWLAAPEQFQSERARLEQFVRGAQQAGFTHALLLGMGGSSMCPEVCRTTFGVAPGYLDLAVVDTTDPATIRAREQGVELARTLFIVSSKSGTTTETLSLYRYFYHRLHEQKGEAAGENFIAITDASTPLEREARERGFRDCFLNPADIGGRFSALSFFGLVPAGLIGMDLGRWLERACGMARACSAGAAMEENPGAVLGAVLAALGANGRDKLTFALDPDIASFGYWVEQLIAESLGKRGKGIVPIEGEALGSTRMYAADRVFARLVLAGRRDAAERRLAALARAGHPLVEIRLSDKYDLAGELFRWEVATAAAGALMQLNPFDEPNVQESKDNTDRLLREFRAAGRLAEEAPALAEGRLKVFIPPVLVPKLVPRRGRARLAEVAGKFFRLARRGDYLGLMAYFQASKEHQRLLQSIRLRLRDSLRAGVTLGYGPRFLHSTGQLHKGGPNNGLFLQLVAADTVDLPVPGEPYSFSVLKQAQALGDFQALAAKQRRVLRIHLGEKVASGLAELALALRRATRRGAPRKARKAKRRRK